MDLHTRGCATAVACWEHYARAIPAARVLRLPGVDAGVFGEPPERDVYNNAILARGMSAPDRAAAVTAMERAYADAGVENFAAWTHEDDPAMVADLERRGYRLSETTRAMGARLIDVTLARPDLELGTLSWDRYAATFGLPDGLLARVDVAALHLRVAYTGNEPVATALAYDHEGDCGIFNVTTLEHARRRGLGTALTLRQLHDAAARGCTTATLQSTPMAEGVYRAAGFRDLGRILEYAPPTRSGARAAS